MLDKNNFKNMIPNIVRSKFTNRPILQKIIKNIGWFSFGRALELILALTIGILVARYLGPSDFGLLNYAIAFVALFSPLINLGLDSVLNRELVNSPKKKYVLLGTVFKLKLVSSIFFGILMLLIIFLIAPNNPMIFFLVLVFVLSTILDSIGCIGIYFNSRIESDKVVKTTGFALVVSNIFKLVLIYLNFSLIWFALASLLNNILILFLYLFYYYKSNQRFFLWKFNSQVAKKLLFISWPLILSGVFSIIYLKIDQVMIGLLLNEYQLGLYSVAVKISEIWYFLPGVIALSLFPSIMSLRKKSNKLYCEKLQTMFDLFTWIPIVLIIPIFIFSNAIVYFLYGPEYIASGFILSILIWGLLAVFIRSGVENYINFEKLYKLSLYSSLFGAFINILLNLLFIPLFGILGAAISTIFSYFFVAYLSNLFFKETRKIFIMQIKSFNLFRILLNYFKK